MVKNHPFIPKRNRWFKSPSGIAHGMIPAQKAVLWRLTNGSFDVLPVAVRRQHLKSRFRRDRLTRFENHRGTVGKTYRTPIQLSQNHLTYKEVSLLEAWHVFLFGGRCLGVHSCMLFGVSKGGHRSKFKCLFFETKCWTSC